jgi:hypothetical protein
VIEPAYFRFVKRFQRWLASVASAAGLVPPVDVMIAAEAGR